MLETATVSIMGTTDLAFDNNNETVCESPYVIMDAHTPKVVDGLLLLPKNSDNGITEGNQYALYYYQNGVWKLHGRKTARYNYIEFDDVPSNTLYWLRNETTGVEELPFFYKYDEQVFINSL